MKHVISPEVAVESILDHLETLSSCEQRVSELRGRILTLCESLSGVVEPGDVVRAGDVYAPADILFFRDETGTLTARRLAIKDVSKLRRPSEPVAFPDEDDHASELN